MTDYLARRSRVRRRLVLAAGRDSAAGGTVAEVERRGRGDLTRQFIRETLAGERPVNWVVTGQDLTPEPSDGEPDEGLGVTARFEARVRRRLNRRDDAVICSALRGDRLQWLLQDLDRRVLQHDPAATVIVVGRCLDGEDHRQVEVTALARILERLTAEDVAAVVLPPTPPGAGESLTLTREDEDLRRQVEMTARRHAAVVVPTAECDSPALLAEALARGLDMDRLLPRPPAARPGTAVVAPSPVGPPADRPPRLWSTAPSGV